jgi:hypothetical protein
MTLAAILAVYVLSFAWLSPSLSSFAGIADGQQSQTQPTQSAQPAQPQSAPSGQTQNSTSPAKPTPTPRKHRKKTGVPDCPNSPTPLNTAAGNSNGSTKSASTATANSGPGNASSGNSSSASKPSASPEPCLPAKKVIRNGGTDEPTLQLTEGTTPAQASQELATTEQLTAFTEENLKKIADRQLDASQQEIVNQIKQFLDESKKAVAAGDLERARNLALKARLLSDELLKP